MSWTGNIIGRIKGGCLLNPVWLSEYRLHNKIKSVIDVVEFSQADKWLDVGCGTRPYENLFPDDTYVGVDVEVSGRDQSLKSPDHFYDGKVLPFSDNSFEGVISTQALEHVSDPRALLAEAYRVIKPGGGLVISLPFVWQEHEEPYDFFRFTSFGIAEILEKTGFVIEDMHKDSGAVETIAMMANVYVTHNFVPPIRGAGSIVSLLVCFPVQLIAMLLQKILPDRGQLYLNLVIKARKA